ncbi:hypothetical protein DFH06DRAFT_1162034 [Mycena polygramma]|nr:hypothetical protein DFH06DRAFT_1162034 [Mycena polygramma]
MEDTATARFQAALPFALLPVSPSLSALHTTRTRSSSNSCQQCGCVLHRGESTIRTTRSRVSKSRAIQTTCLACGWVQKVALARGNAALFPRTRKAGAKGSAIVHATIVDMPDTKPTIQEAQEPSSDHPPRIKPPQAPPALTPAKSRSKKKGGLQSMLDRNKERESRDKKQSGNGHGGGLAMFLNNL